MCRQLASKLLLVFAAFCLFEDPIDYMIFYVGGKSAEM